MLIVITGPSGCGKSTLANLMLTELENVEFSVSYTTRKKRDAEIEGKDYFFVSKETFERMIQKEELAEWAVVHGCYYGTPKNTLERDSVDRDLLLDIDVQGAEQIREKHEGAVFVFILPPVFPELRERLEKRGQDSLPIIQKRLDTAREEIQRYREFDYVVINDELSKAAEELKSVILGQRCRREIREKEILPIMRSFAEGD
ncbi:MAG: guanylate kinase [Candidatus Aminicenantes bacterium]|nr:MAG: guanylate kinase [Candidatus Aminicenantes bacterium]